MKLAEDPIKPLTSSSLPIALAQNLGVEAKVEECAGELHQLRELTRNHAPTATQVVPALLETLTPIEQVEEKVQECAKDLSQVNAVLSQEVRSLNQMQAVLAETERALEQSESALAISREKEKTAQLQAFHDSMTKLPNRDLFDDRLVHAISMAKRHDWSLVVMFLDLDSFKAINDTHGHNIGDLVLIEIAKRLLSSVREEDTVCRNGGDEFLYLLVNPQGREGIERIASRVLEMIGHPVDIGSRKVAVTSSIGIAIFPETGSTGEELIRNADVAMYKAKTSKNGWCFS